MRERRPAWAWVGGKRGTCRGNVENSEQHGSVARASRRRRRGWGAHGKTAESASCGSLAFSPKWGGEARRARCDEDCHVGFWSVCTHWLLAWSSAGVRLDTPGPCLWGAAVSRGVEGT